MRKGGDGPISNRYCTHSRKTLAGRGVSRGFIKCSTSEARPTCEISSALFSAPDCRPELPVHCAYFGPERLKLALSELSAQQEKNINIAEEYSELIKNLEDKQREDAQQVWSISARQGGWKAIIATKGAEASFSLETWAKAVPTQRLYETECEHRAVDIFTALPSCWFPSIPIPCMMRSKIAFCRRHCAPLSLVGPL